MQKSQSGRRTFCVHCASLGEFEQGRPLIEALRRDYPDVRLVLTFFSPSGYEVRRDYAGVDAVYYLPFDRPRAVRRFLEVVAPDKFFVVKYEFWYHLLSQLRARDCEVYLVSGIFRRGQVFFRRGWFGAFYRRILGFFDTIFVQDAASAELLAGIGLDDRVVVAGDTRFDRVVELFSAAASASKDLPLLAEFTKGAGFTVVCGSTWPADDHHLLALMSAHPDWHFIVAPHQISSDYIDGFIARSGRPAVRYSTSSSHSGATLLVLDTIGVLSRAYQYGQVAYVGGGFGVGIHNTLEAAVWGIPVVFGPNFGRFLEAVEMATVGGAFPVATTADLLAVMGKLRKEHSAAGAIAGTYVRQKTGATARILSLIAGKC